MTIVITGDKYTTKTGTVIVYDNQKDRFSIGDKIVYKGERYIIERIFPPTRPNGKWSLGVVDVDKMED